MIKKKIYLTVFPFFIFLYLLLVGHYHPINAAYSATISATVPTPTPSTINIYPAQLITPSNNSLTQNPKETFSWYPGYSNYGIDFESFYLDGQLIATNIQPGLTESDYYFYHLKKINNLVYLYPKYNLPDGWHYWHITTQKNNQTVDSDTFRFYLDSTFPLIILTQVDKTKLYWATNDPQSIPQEANRYLIVHTPNPLLKGKVEAYSNLTFSLANQTITVNEIDGNWEHRFYNLSPNTTYPVYISAIDAANNQTSFPVFYLTYLPVSIGNIILPTPTPNPQELPTITPQPTSPEQQIPNLPTPPPPSPTPTTLTPTITSSSNTGLILFYLSVFGLLLHLTLAIIGFSIPLRLIPQFLIKLAYPFLFNHNFQSKPFTIIKLYQPNYLKSAWKTLVTDTTGFYSLPSNLPKQLFIKLYKTAHLTPSAIINSSSLSQVCLSPLLQNHLNALQRLQLILVRLRILPLFAAIITSIVCLLFFHNYFIIIYLYLSLQYFYSQYLYH